MVYASPLGAFLTEYSVTNLFLPPILTLTANEIHIRRRMFLGLRSLDQKISVDRVASVRASSGVIWGGVAVETYGGATGILAINGLNKQDARLTAQVIERLANIGPYASKNV